MTTPETKDDPKLIDVLDELVNARSSLHMYDTLEPGFNSDEPFIDEKYEFAKHAAEHLVAATLMMFKLISREEEAKRLEWVKARFESRDTY